MINSPSFMKYRLRLITVLSVFIWLLQSCTTIPSSCSDGWYITGYYTPVEKSYHAKPVEISLKNTNRYSFPKKFLDEVKIEGWGKTRFGWYLGYYGKKWHKSKHPLDSTGRPLIRGIAATDPRYIPTGLTIKIDSKISYLKNTNFVARDVGSKIKKHHIDIYTGEGTKAKRQTFEITGKHSICIFF